MLEPGRRIKIVPAGDEETEANPFGWIAVRSAPVSMSARIVWGGGTAVTAKHLPKRESPRLVDLTSQRSRTGADQSLPRVGFYFGPRMNREAPDQIVFSHVCSRRQLISARPRLGCQPLIMAPITLPVGHEVDRQWIRRDFEYIRNVHAGRRRLTTLDRCS